MLNKLSTTEPYLQASLRKDDSSLTNHLAVESVVLSRWELQVGKAWLNQSVVLG